MDRQPDPNPVNDEWKNWTINGQHVTEEQIQAWADEAERGYTRAQFRKMGRPTLGPGAARAVAIRLDPVLEADLDDRAKRDGVSRSEIVRDALRAYLRSA